MVQHDSAENNKRPSIDTLGARRYPFAVRHKLPIPHPGANCHLADPDDRQEGKSR
jgi:hypothetical protein